MGMRMGVGRGWDQSWWGWEGMGMNFMGMGCGWG